MISHILTNGRTAGKEQRELFSIYTWLWTGSETKKELCRKGLLKIAFDETIKIEKDITIETTGRVVQMLES